MLQNLRKSQLLAMRSSGLQASQSREQLAAYLTARSFADMFQMKRFWENVRSKSMRSFKMGTTFVISCGIEMQAVGWRNQDDQQARAVRRQLQRCIPDGDLSSGEEQSEGDAPQKL